MSVYYNEIDRRKAAALKALMEDGFISDGDIDTRDIREVKSDDLKGYTRCHFFAGIGLWDYALQLALCPDDRPVWTGSCPCQPFSAAGKRKGEQDERHLFPVWERLIAERRPPVVLGEQVASKDGRLWFAGVRAALEALGYGVGGADLCAASLGAPHIRQRLFWVADCKEAIREQPLDSWERRPRPADSRGMEHPFRTRLEGHTGHGEDVRETPQDGPGCPAGIHDFWADFGLVVCREPDGNEKRRRIKPGTFPLAYGYPERVGIIHAAGDGIVPQLAAEFIIASEEARGLR